jgi:ABC-2 type transport system ATP-binding protein
MLQLDGLTKRYGAVVALDGCDLAVGRGEMVGFVGPNGAGKTTAMRSVFGLAAPEAGSVTWDGEPVDHEIRRRFGYMPEERGLYPRMRAARQIVYFARLHGLTKPAATDAAERLLATLGLADRADARVDELSHGNQQRMQLAVAIAHDPELLVLDEPFAGLDPVAAATLADVLAERARAGAAVLFSSHQLDLVEDLCPQVVVIDRGRIVLAGAIEDLRAASPRRYLEVSTEGAPADWEALIPGARVVTRMGARTRLLLPAGADLVKLAEIARATGDVVQFSLSPPDLSEVFRETVGQ